MIPSKKNRGRPIEKGSPPKQKKEKMGRVGEEMQEGLLRSKVQE
jgi:hypothetical protein